MKRFVKEFAVSCTNKNYNPEINEKIMKIVSLCDKGMITNYEAVRSIVQFCESLQDKKVV